MKPVPTSLLPVALPLHHQGWYRMNGLVPVLLFNVNLSLKTWIGPFYIHKRAQHIHTRHKYTRTQNGLCKFISFCLNNKLNINICVFPFRAGLVKRPLGLMPDSNHSPKSEAKSDTKSEPASNISSPKTPAGSVLNCVLIVRKC